MSAHATSITAHADHHGHDESKFQIYVQIAMLLAVITGIEIVIVYVPFAKWLLVSALVVLSAVPTWLLAARTGILAREGHV